MIIDSSCTWIAILIIFLGSVGNWLCICVFFRKRFRFSMLTPFFVGLLIADCIYLTCRVFKLLYYQQTLFRNLVVTSSCSSSILIQLYGYFSQNAPHIFVPLCHYEFYIRFSLILMAFLAIQRAYDMLHSSYRILRKHSSTRSFSYILIAIAFLLAYLFEFFGLSIFCSSELSSTIAYEWYTYMRKNLVNETEYFLTFLKNQSNNQSEIDCLMGNTTVCSSERVAHIVRHYFDMHQRSIVYLIHKVQIATIGVKMARNELRLKYQYHSCPIRLQPDLFLQIFDLLYSRTLGFNRYTIILAVGSIMPSMITILGNAISLRCIIATRGSIIEQTHASRRRTDETRRVVIIITIECLLAILNSWFVDIILSINYCSRSVAIGDDCPDFLHRSQTLLAFCDLLNSMSNIVLHCFAGRRFRHELKRMLKAWIHTIKKRMPCYCYIRWREVHHLRRKYGDEQYATQLELVTKPSKNPQYLTGQKQSLVKLRVVTYPTTVL